MTAKRETLRKTMFGIKKNKSSVTKDDTEKVAEKDNESLENKETKEDVSEELEEEKTSKKESLMGRLLSETPTPPEIDDIIEGKVLGIEKSSVYIDLPPFGTGIIYGREYLNARDIIRKINIGDTVAGKVVSLDNKDGYIEISLKEARQALLWSEAEDAIRDKTVFELTVQDANKGGLIIGWQGIQGFLPASQLKPEHYPRVDDGDKEKILGELRKLVDQKIAVSIISAIPKEGKLIFSEKDREQKDRTEMVDKFSLGDELVGEITGIVDFGIFVKIEEELEGLVHISEIDWGLVENPRTMFKVGDKVKVKIIEIKDGKISLSIKALKENPWVEASKKYKKDDIVKGVVIKFNKHGALASIEEGVAGLIHISEFGSEDKLREKLELGKTYDFKITLFDPKEQKMALTHTITEKQ